MFDLDITANVDNPIQGHFKIDKLIERLSSEQYLICWFMLDKKILKIHSYIYSSMNRRYIRFVYELGDCDVVIILKYFYAYFNPPEIKEHLEKISAFFVSLEFKVHDYTDLSIHLCNRCGKITENQTQPNSEIMCDACMGKPRIVMFPEENIRRRSNENKFVYLLESNNNYKIGIADDVEGRIKSLQTGTPHEIKPIFFKKRKDAKEMEYHLHKKYHHKHIRGEWFSFTEQEIIEIRETINTGVPDEQYC